MFVYNRGEDVIRWGKCTNYSNTNPSLHLTTPLLSAHDRNTGTVCEKGVTNHTGILGLGLVEPLARSRVVDLGPILTAFVTPWEVRDGDDEETALYGISIRICNLEKIPLVI